MMHSEEQLAAATDLLADGYSSADAAKMLASMFDVSLRTGQRLVAAVSCDMSDTVPECDTDQASTDYLGLALQAMAQAVRAAQAAGDHNALASRADQLAGMVAKTKVRFAP